MLRHPATNFTTLDLEEDRILSGLIEKSAPALLLGIFVAALLPSDWAAAGLFLAPILVLGARRLVLPLPGPSSLAAGALISQVGVLTMLSASPNQAALEGPIIGSFAARSGATFALERGDRRRTRFAIESLGAAEGDANAIQLEVSADSDRPAREPGTSPGLPYRLDGWLEPRLDRPWRFRGVLREDREALALNDQAGRLRRRLAGRLAVNLPASAEPFMAALVLGLRLEDQELRDLLAKSGAGHFFVVSGLHVGLLAALVLRLGAACGLDRRRAMLAVLPIALLYALVSGGRPPVMRALALVTFLVAADLLGRPTRPFRLLMTISATALVLSPDLLRDPSFTFSFTAVAGILALGGRGASEAEPLERFLARKRGPSFARGARATLRMSAAAFLATAPLSLLSQGNCAPISILASLPLLPLVTLMLVLAALALATPLPEAPLDLLIEVLVRLLKVLAAVPGGRVETGTAPLGAALLAWAALAAGGLLARQRARALLVHGLPWAGFLLMLAWAAWVGDIARFEPGPGSQSLGCRWAGGRLVMATGPREGPLILALKEVDGHAVELAISDGAIVAMRLEEAGETMLVVGADPARFLDLPWDQARTIVFAGPCSAAEAAALCRRYGVEDFASLRQLEAETRRILAGDGVRERPEILR